MAAVSAGFAKCFILLIAIVVLLQGVAYLGLSIWGIAQDRCEATTDIMQNPFKFAMDTIYFLDKSCGDPKMTLQGTDYTMKMIDWSASYRITHREYIFMITYAVVSGLWVVTSLLVITTLCSTTTKVIAGIVYWPWFLSILAGCILDVVASVFHGIDITKTTSLDNTFEYIGATRPEVNEILWAQLEPYGVYFSTPAILLLCLSCRVVLIWLLNLIGGIFCLSLSNNLAKQHSSDKRVLTNLQVSQAPTRPQTPNVLAQPGLVEAEQASIVLAQSPQPEYTEQYPQQIRPKPLPIIIPAHHAELAQMQPQDTRLYKPSDRTTMQSPVVILPPAMSPLPQESVQTDINTYRTTDAHPDQLNYPSSEVSTPVRSPSPAVPQLAVTSPLNTRYAESLPSQATPNARVSQELRNQMPWSYTSMITKPPPPPRKPQQQVQIYPQIPEPDYGEH